ncbi:hypothetical protein [Sphingomonas sp.]|uniref:hypothetical protein n=1 Tax=Sphingomonas sp. TaxID=28214 RepID=UPI0018047446|nr:hypothetical protein [Sphingomonas sp.]MBA3510676.1 hypothetical protein [Sphingomonas sp.]
MKKSPIKINYVVLCDDIRTEEGGKNILIGVYSETVVIPANTPRFIGPLAFYIRATLPHRKAVAVSTWIEGPAGEKMNETDWGLMGVLGDVDTNAGLIVWKLMPWRSEGLGAYKLHMIQGGIDSVIYEFDIRN